MTLPATSFNTLLVPIDFSPASEAAFDYSLRLASGDNAVVILLHVIDPAFVDFAEAHEFGVRNDLTKQMRDRAELQLTALKDRADVNVEIDVIVSEGPPFLEILRKSQDFIVDAIVLGKVGMRTGIEKMLFGSTAEKVLRGSQCPVLVLPYGN